MINNLKTLIALFTICLLFSCDYKWDDHNIVEPRFYDDNEITTVYADSTLLIKIFVPKTSMVEMSVIGQAGNLVNKLIDNVRLIAGINYYEWNLKNKNGEKIEEGIYGISVTCDDNNELYWLDIKFK